MAKEWFVDGLGSIILAILVLVMIIVVMKQVGLHLHDFFKFFGQEGKDLLSLNPTIGAVNFGGLLIVSVSGILGLAAIKFVEVLQFLAIFLSDKKVDFLHNTMNYQMIIYVVAFVAVNSIWAVVWSKRK